MTPQKMRAYLYLGAICTAVVALDYLPFGSTMNVLAAIAVLILDIWVAEKMLRQLATNGPAS